MVVRSRGRWFSGAVAGLTLTFAVTGCGGGTKDRTQESPSASTTSASPTPAPSESPSESPTESPTGPATGSPSTPPEPSKSEPPEPKPTEDSRRLADQPLSAQEVPGFNAEYSWTVASNRTSEGRQLVGTCHKFAMTSIGAAKVAVRTYQAAPQLDDRDSTAANLVAEFADTRTAKRAYEVLKSWSGQCAEELVKHETHDIGKLQSVQLPAGLSPATAAADWYLLTYGPVKGDQDAAYFDAQGMTRVGKRVSVLEMRSAGQDYNYRAGQEPMAKAVKASAAKLAQ